MYNGPIHFNRFMSGSAQTSHWTGKMAWASKCNEASPELAPYTMAARPGQSEEQPLMG